MSPPNRTTYSTFSRPENPRAVVIRQETVIPLSEVQLLRRKRNRECGCIPVFLVLTIFVLLLFVLPDVPQQKELVLAGGDRRLVVPRTRWIKELTIEGPSDIKAYLFDVKPKRSETIILPSMQLVSKLSLGVFQYARVDLFPGSEVTVNFAFDGQKPNFLVLKGRLAFELWRFNQIIVPSATIHNEKSLFGKVKFITPDTGFFDSPDVATEYYFIFYLDTTDINAHSDGIALFYISARSYSLKDAVKSCYHYPASGYNVSSLVNSGIESQKNIRDCRLELFPGRKAFILLVPSSALGLYPISYRLVGRDGVLFYHVVFAVIAVLITLAFLFWCYSSQSREYEYEVILPTENDPPPYIE